MFYRFKVLPLRRLNAQTCASECLNDWASTRSIVLMALGVNYG
jgi:hypothetical protein